MNVIRFIPDEVIVVILMAALSAHSPDHYPTPPYPPGIHVEQTGMVSVGPSVLPAGVYISTARLS